MVVVVVREMGAAAAAAATAAAEGAHGAQRRLAAIGRGTRAGRAARHRVTGAGADCEGGAVTALGDGVQLPQTAEQPEQEEQEEKRMN